ncbi:MAG: phosphoglucomutase/phosphomannomutase family protein [Balneolaceae bacterium]|nr:phosphoglucomutase/phosphomannomutase family protein [Balneolaceae bacterium]
MNIAFGTDGWRAVVARDFTYENLNRVTQATARWIADEQITRNGVVIGHDARFEGRAFTEYAASVFAAMDIPVRFAASIAPTPAVSWAAQEYDAVGVVITASHNPPAYNGFKIKAPFGGPATPEQIAAVEQRLASFDPDLDPGAYRSWEEKGLIEEIPLTKQYLQLLEEVLDLDAIRESDIRLAHDPMYGSGQGLLTELLGKDQVEEIHGSFNPSFGGTPPEPIEKNLTELARLIPERGCDTGLANDGDADRIGMFDEKGNFVSSHKLLSLLVKYLHTEKGMDGSIVKTFSTTDMLDKQAERYGLPLDVTPIGFKYIAEKMVEGNVLVGGEESGGLAVKGHIPERDGLFIGLTIVEMMVRSGKNLSRLVEELFEEFGPHHFDRNDLHTSDERKKAMIRHCEEKKLTELAGKKVGEWQFTDGIKHIMEDRSWLLVRPSGTEPVLRIYAEASSLEEARNMVSEATNIVKSLQV